MTTINNPKKNSTEITDEKPVKFESNLKDSFTFESFVTGKSNHNAHTVAMQAASGAGSGYHPLVVYGDTGIGKTHLLHAIGNQVHAINPQARILYFHSEQYMQDMIRAARKNASQSFRNLFHSINLLIIDDIHFLEGKHRTQEEFIYTFDALMDMEHQIIMSCNRHPNQLEDLDDRLQSRLGSGSAVAIEPPELETRINILHSKAETMGVNLPHEAALFIGGHVRSNVRELEGALRRVAKTSQLMGTNISIDIVKDALKDR